MTFKNWLFSVHPEGDAYSGQWKFPHIFTLCLCIALVVAIALIFRKKKRTTRELVVKILAILILIFEIARRIINFSKGSAVDLKSALYMLLPRPWCAISCWLTIAAATFNKKTLWNFATMNSLLCSLIFFAYPSVGFNHKTILFENLYSIATHALLFVTSLSALVLRLGDFRYKRETFVRGAMKEGIMLVCVFAYALVEIYVLKIEPDPLCFMANNDVQKVLGMGYGGYLAVYAIFLCVWFNAFYLIPMLWNKYVKKGRTVAEEVGEEEETANTVKSGRYLKTKGEPVQTNKRKR